MRSTPQSIQRLIREFNKLPGIGSKTSERFVYHLLRHGSEDIELLAQGLLNIKDTIRLCRTCYTYTEDEVCTMCSDSQRDKSIICVVAEPNDVEAFEKTGEFDGVYHVLGGVINHADGIGPHMLRITELVTRVTNQNVKEVILATNPDMEGETTALYITQQLGATPVRITKIARGVPVGGDIEFADEVTLGNALTGRQEVSKR